MNNAQWISLGLSFLKWGGGALVITGHADPTQVDTLLGAAATVVALVASFYQHKA